MKTKTLIIALFTLLLTGCGSSGKGFNPLGISPAGTTPTATATAAPTVLAAASPTPVPSPTPAERWVVCTGYADGTLNVRSCPGVQCWAHDALYEGQEVVPAGGTATPPGAPDEFWWHIVQPVEGWVRAKFLCQGKAK